MSTTYPDLLNNFPDSIDNFDRMSDPALEDLDLIDQYYALYNNKDLVGANALIEANPQLKKCLFNAENYNIQRDAIIASQRFYMNDVQQYLINIVKYKNNYNSNTQYQKYDVVEYVVDNATQHFMCISTDVPIGTLPTDNIYFTKLTLRGEQGVSGTGLSYRGHYDNAKQYYKDDCVAYNGALWSANVDNLNSYPIDDNTDWNYIMGIQKQIVLSSFEPLNQIEGDIWYEIIAR